MSIKKPMAVSERAKQFMPFKAVAGLDEALELKRIEMGKTETVNKDDKLKESHQ